MFVCNLGKVQCIMFIAKSRKFASFKIRSEDLGYDNISWGHVAFVSIFKIFCLHFISILH